MKLNIAIFASGNGSNFKSIVEKNRINPIINICFLFCDNQCANVINIAKKHNIKHYVSSKQSASFEKYSDIHQKCITNQIHYILLAGYMDIIPSEFVNKWQNKIINIHPSLLPKYPGKLAIKRAWENKDKEIGVTIHVVTNKVDNGIILAQEAIALNPKWTLAETTLNVHKLEHEMYFATLNYLCKDLAKNILMSCSNKQNLDQISKFFITQNFNIYATSSTWKFLTNKKINIKKLENLTTHPEMLNGRVKTLDQAIYFGILANPHDKSHIIDMEKYKFPLWGIIIVNLYPFDKNLKFTFSMKNLIELIDIGGVSLIRAAVKNFLNICVIIDPNDYKYVVNEYQTQGFISLVTRINLAAKAISFISYYDSIVSSYYQKLANNFNEHFAIPVSKINYDFRYGENPHQMVSGYKINNYSQINILHGTQIHGKKLSYNNIFDSNAALTIAKDFLKIISDNEFLTISLKHQNPCGIGVCNSKISSWLKCYDGDNVSIFGGIVFMSYEIDLSIANYLSKLFLEIVIAPSFTNEAKALLCKKKNLRLIVFNRSLFNYSQTYEYVVSGDSLFVHEKDVMKKHEMLQLECVTKTSSKIDKQELFYAWIAAKNIKSNAIAVWQNGMLMGTGAGQLNRVKSAKLSLEQNADKLCNAILASDAFFPMPDSIELISKYSINAIIQPGGSIKDNEVIEACNKYNISMYFVHKRHFKH